MVPSAWMPPAKMERVIVHWSGGAYKANAADKKSYHLLIDGDGSLVRGDRTIKDNESTQDGVYAAHTLNCNTGSIGVSMCSMGGPGVTEDPFNPGKYPLNQTQWAALHSVLADLCTIYKIPVTPQTVLTHAEVEETLGIDQRSKWDITRLTFLPNVKGARPIGDIMRAEVTSELARRRMPPERPSVVVRAEEPVRPAPMPPLVILPAGGHQPDVEPVTKPAPTTGGTAAQAGGAAAGGAAAIGLLAYNWKLGLAVLVGLAVVAIGVWLVRR